MACKALADTGRNTFPPWMHAFPQAPALTRFLRTAVRQNAFSARQEANCGSQRNVLARRGWVTVWRRSSLASVCHIGTGTILPWTHAFPRASTPARFLRIAEFANQTPADGKRCPLPQHLTYCGRATVWQAARQVSACRYSPRPRPWTHAFSRASRRASSAPQFAKTPFRLCKRRTVAPGYSTTRSADGWQPQIQEPDWTIITSRAARTDGRLATLPGGQGFAKRRTEVLPLCGALPRPNCPMPPDEYRRPPCRRLKWRKNHEH